MKPITDFNPGHVKHSPRGKLSTNVLHHLSGENWVEICSIASLQEYVNIAVRAVHAVVLIRKQEAIRRAAHLELICRTFSSNVTERLVLLGPVVRLEIHGL